MNLHLRAGENLIKEILISYLYANSAHQNLASHDARISTCRSLFARRGAILFF